MEKQRRLLCKIIIAIAAVILIILFEAGLLEAKYYIDRHTPGWHERDAGTCYVFPETFRLGSGIENIDGNLYCFGSDSYLLYGWIQYEDHIYYANESGILARGAIELDGNTRYFHIETGELISGWQEEEDGKRYYLGDGTRAVGYRTIDGTEYKFEENGLLYAGFDNSADGTRLYTDHGLAEGLLVWDNATYYFRGCLMQYGWQQIGGSWYYFDNNGRMLTGWQTIHDETYYFAENGCLMTDVQVGMYLLDSDGVATKAPATIEYLDAYLDDILATYGRSPEQIHHAVNSMIRYKATPEGTIEQMACDAINTGRGACWSYASLGYVLLRRAGYEVYYIRGTYSPTGNVHCWLYVHFDDGWYYMDCLHANRVKLTEKQYAALHFSWDKTGLPENEQTGGGRP